MAAEWERYYSDNDIRHIQSIEIDSLKVFAELCKKLQIDFVLYGGSLLGAVKYNGFIPWDDDLDVALLRDDYEKLIKFGNNLLSELYEIQHPSNNKVTPYFYAKFRRKDTKMVEYENHRLKMNHGIYFDIYPIDHLPDDDNILAVYHEKYRKWVRLFLLRQNHFLSRPVKIARDRIRAFLKWGVSVGLHIIPHYVFVKIINGISTEYNAVRTRRRGNYSFPKPVNYFDKFFPLIEVDFEGLTMKMPAGYKENLRNRYGDISGLPPEDKRVGHKPYLLDFGDNQLR